MASAAPAIASDARGLVLATSGGASIAPAPVVSQ